MSQAVHSGGICCVTHQHLLQIELSPFRVFSYFAVEQRPLCFYTHSFGDDSSNVVIKHIETSTMKLFQSVKSKCKISADMIMNI